MKLPEVERPTAFIGKKYEYWIVTIALGNGKGGTMKVHRDDEILKKGFKIPVRVPTVIDLPNNAHYCIVLQDKGDKLMFGTTKNKIEIEKATIGDVDKGQMIPVTVLP